MSWLHNGYLKSLRWLIEKQISAKVHVYGEEEVGMPNFGLSNLPHIFNAFKYRDRAGIICDILTTIRTSREGRNKTQIMQSANLNYVQTKKYLGYMIGCGYLLVTQNETYVVTEKGARYLQFIEVQGLRRIR